MAEIDAVNVDAFGCTIKHLLAQVSTPNNAVALHSMLW
jgi:hypothetical protein